MPRTSKFRLDQKQLQEINSHLLFLISSLKNSGEAERFFGDFLTKEEKVMLSKRLVLFMMIKKGYGPSVIQSALHVSYETVRTYQNQLYSKDKFFHVTLDKLIKRQRTLSLFAKIDKLLKPIDLALKSKSNMQARAKLASGDWD